MWGGIGPDWGGRRGAGGGAVAEPGVGKRAITRHVLWVMVAMHVVEMVRLQHGVVGNIPLRSLFTKYHSAELAIRTCQISVADFATSHQ